MLGADGPCLPFGGRASLLLPRVPPQSEDQFPSPHTVWPGAEELSKRARRWELGLGARRLCETPSTAVGGRPRQGMMPEGKCGGGGKPGPASGDWAGADTVPVPSAFGGAFC